MAKKRKDLNLEDQAKLIMHLGPLFQALGECAGKLAVEGIGYDSRFDAKKGVLKIRFYRLEEK